MRKRTSTEQSYEPLVTPESWKGDELRFSVRLTQILDGLFARLRAMRTELAGKLGRTEQAADSAKLGGVSAGSFALKTDTAPNAEKLGGKAPEYYLNPVNLLDNSDFSNPVNQRGQTTFTGVGTYTIDRWYVGGSNQRIDIASGSIKAITTKGSAYATIAQTVANITRYAGKTLTFAAYVRSNVVPRLNIYNGETSFANTRGTSGDYQVITCSFVVPNGIAEGALSVRIQSISTQVDDYVEAQWAALYEGAYTAETLPPYVPKPYAVELAECQRYYRSENVTALHNAYLDAANRAYFSIPTNIKMRLPKPTANYIDATNGGLYQGSDAAITINSSNSTLTVAAMGNSEIRLILILNEDTSLFLFREAMVRIPPFELVADL